MLNEDYRDILRCLLEEKVDFIIVGAYALGAHGLPRATGDIHIFIKPEGSNSHRVYNALKAFGTPLSGISPDDFVDEGVIVQIGVAPRRVVIITQIDGVSYQDADSDKIIVTVDGLDLPVLSLKMLIRNKEASGREKDLLDLKILYKRLKNENNIP